jgi:putative aldouronate transport system substrate-binding protein
MMTYPSQNYQERVNVIVAAGDTPDLLLVPDPFGWNNDIFDGMFWDLNPYIHDYPHLQAVINSFEGRLTRDNGGLYGIPRLSNPDIGVFPALRKDWLEKVGLTIPHTMEQLYEVLQAFEARDPDGNGKKDTVALAGSVNALSLGDLSWVENVFNESGGRFKLQDGVIIDTTVEPGTKEALKWLRDAFAAGILAKDFAVASSDQAMNLVTSNHGGTMALSQQLVWKANQELRDSISNPAVDFSQLAYLQAREGGAKVVPSSIGHTGIFTIPKNVTEAKLKRILAFLENWLSGDIPEDEYNSLLPLEPFFGQRSASTVTNVELSASEQESVLQILEERAAIQFTHGNDPTLGLFSNEMRSAMHTIDQMLTQTKIKIIVGQLPLNEWDRILAQLKSDSQYLSVMKELNEKSNKKMASIAN